MEEEKKINYSESNATVDFSLLRENGPIRDDAFDSERCTPKAIW